MIALGVPLDVIGCGDWELKKRSIGEKGKATVHPGSGWEGKFAVRSWDVGRDDEDFSRERGAVAESRFGPPGRAMPVPSGLAVV
jgi:hypothetical protein